MSNVNKLIAYKVAIDAIPAGGGVAAGVAFLSDRARIVSSLRQSYAWVKEVIKLVKEAAEPNPWKVADDEAIAGEILRRIEEKHDKKSSTAC